MSSNPEYKSVSVLELDKCSGKPHKNMYLIKVIKNTDKTLIGNPIKNINDRVRIEKLNDKVLFYKSGEDDKRIREEKLEEVRDKTPEWLDYYNC